MARPPEKNHDVSANHDISTAIGLALGVLAINYLVISTL